MSASKPVPIAPTGGRKPYKKPTATKLTLEAAKTALEATSIPGDEQAEKLLEAIRTQLKKQ